jgi:hypothetical protein
LKPGEEGENWPSERFLEGVNCFLERCVVLALGDGPGEIGEEASSLLL